MTLIITGANRKFLFQSADTRLTLQSGQLFDDDSVKQAQIKGDNFCLLISYTGIAHIKKEKVHNWLTNELSDYKLEGKNSKDILTFLRKKLDKQGITRDLILAGIGWRNHKLGIQRFYFKLSNIKNKKFILSESVINEPTFIRCEGCLPATQEDYFSKRLKKFCKLLRREKTKDRLTIMDRLTQLIRIGASHTVHGKWIGKNITSLLMSISNSSPIAKYYSSGKTVKYFPNSISSAIAIKGLKITEDDTQDSFFKINPTTNKPL